MFISLGARRNSQNKSNGFSIHVVLRSGAETGSFSNDEGDGNENSKNVTMFNFAK